MNHDREKEVLDEIKRTGEIQIESEELPIGRLAAAMATFSRELKPASGAGVEIVEVLQNAVDEIVAWQEPAKTGQQDPQKIYAIFTMDEAALVLALIRRGWETAALGSRRGFDLMAAAEDELVKAGAPATVPAKVSGAGQ